MTNYEKRTIEVCRQMYKRPPQQFLIEFIEQEVNGLFARGNDNPVTRDEVNGTGVLCKWLLRIYNPSLQWDVALLTSLETALFEWAKDIEATNLILGIPREK